MSDLVSDLLRSQRPVIVYGGGMRHADALAIRVAQTLKIPVLTTWAARDMMPESEPLNIGGFGTHCLRYANFAIQNADFILCVGSRLDTKATGPLDTFAPRAKLWMVDVDLAETQKFPRASVIIQDAKAFLQWFSEFILAYGVHDINNSTWRRDDWAAWLAKIQGWKLKYRPTINAGEGTIDPYHVIKVLSRLTTDETICMDIGTVLVYAAQAFEFTRQRMIYAWNQGPMGYGLPSAIAAAQATGKKVVYLAGDASMHMAMGEMATLARLQLPVKTIIFNNRGHGLVRQTQRQWFDGRYESTSVEGGLPDCDFRNIAFGYGFSAARETENVYVKPMLDWLLSNNYPAFLELTIPHEAESTPLCRFNAPLHDAEPALPREELAEVMRA